MVQVTCILTWQTDSKSWSIKQWYFKWPWTTPNPDFKGTPLQCCWQIEIYWSWVLFFLCLCQHISLCRWYPAKCTVSLCVTKFIRCMRRGIDVSWHADKYHWCT